LPAKVAKIESNTKLGMHFGIYQSEKSLKMLNKQKSLRENHKYIKGVIVISK